MAALPSPVNHACCCAACEHNCGLCLYSAEKCLHCQLVGLCQMPWQSILFERCCVCELANLLDMAVHVTSLTCMACEHALTKTLHVSFVNMRDIKYCTTIATQRLQVQIGCFAVVLHVHEYNAECAIKPAAGLCDLTISVYLCVWGPILPDDCDRPA